MCFSVRNLSKKSQIQEFCQKENSNVKKMLNISFVQVSNQIEDFRQLSIKNIWTQIKSKLLRNGSSKGYQLGHLGYDHRNHPVAENTRTSLFCQKLRSKWCLIRQVFARMENVNLKNLRFHNSSKRNQFGKF